MNKLLKNGIFNTIKMFSNLLFPTITVAYVSRIFGTEGMGRIGFVKSFITIAVAIAMLGIQNYGIREASRIKENREELSLFCKEILRINLMAMAVVYVLLFLAVRLYSKMWDSNILFLIFGLNIIANVIGMEWLYIALEEYRYIAIRSIIVQGVAFVLLFIFVRDKSDINNYALLQVLSASGSYLWNYLHSHKFIDWKVKGTLRYKRHLGPIWKLFATSIFIKIFTDVDTGMLGIMTDDHTTGLYTAAIKISLVMAALIGAAFAILQPRMSVLADGDEKKSRQLLENGYKAMIMITLPLMLGAYLYSRHFIIILNGYDFVEATRTSEILSVRTFLSTLNGLFLISYMLPRKMDTKATYITGITAGMNIVINFLLIPQFRQEGAALATVLTEFAEMLMILFVFRHELDFKRLIGDSWKCLIATGMMSVLVVFIMKWIDNIYVELGVGILCGAIAYCVCLYLQKYSTFCEFINMVKKKR